MKFKYLFVYISASSYIYTNYIFLESTYNTDSHSKISAVGKDFEKYIYIRKNYAITHKGVSPLRVIALLNL